MTSGVARLIDPAEMGNLFKVLALTSPGLPVPAGFAGGCRAICWIMITLAVLDGDPCDPPRLLHPRGRRQRRHLRLAELRLRFAATIRGRSSATARIAASRLGLAAERLVSCHQVHGTATITVEQPWRRDANPRADGMVTAVPGIALGVLAADCAPVLFADPEARIIGAAHGGWRGALGGVMEATVAAMTALGARPERIRAGIGPCIAQPSYEVGPEFEARFAADDPDSGGFFRPAPRAGHFLFDLPGYLAHRLARLGLAAVEQSGARHRRRGGAVLQLSARLPAGRSRLRPRSRGDRAGGIGRPMPYLIMFIVFCLLGVLATCALL